MKIDLKDPVFPITYNINMKDAWVGGICRRFHEELPLDSPVELAGSLTMSSVAGTEYQVNGTVEFAPMLDCSRCQKKLLWNAKRTFKAVYRRHLNTNTKGEKNLSAQELDFYPIEGDVIDLGSLLLEQMFLAIPEQPIRKSADGKSCLECNADISSPLVFESGTKAAGPFANLKQMIKVND
jgi:uncharacterized metal-binding protein YceD (DUF177 family)